MRIMLAIDGSEHSKFAVEETASGLWPENTEMRVITVIQHDNEDVREAAGALVEESALRLTKSVAPPVKVSGDVVLGYPKRVILSEIESWKPDLLAVGSRGLKGLTRVVLGSVSHSLLMSAPCSVRIVRSRGTEALDQGGRVLVAVDDSRFSEDALEEIGSRRWKPDTAFLCVTAVPTLIQLMHEEQVCHSLEGMKDERSEMLTEATALLNKTAARLRKLTGSSLVTAEILDGDPRESVVERAESWHADLIAMGAKGKLLMDRIMIGSVSEAVATWARCSVEVVKRRAAG